MSKKLLFGLVPLTVAAVAGVAVYGADHRDSPTVEGSPAGDIADVYAFQNPNDSGRIALVMTVNGLTAPADAMSQTFDPNVLYEFKIDTDADAVADIAYRTKFSAPMDGGAQSYTVYRAEGPAADGFVGDGTVVAQGQTTAPHPTMPNAPVIAEGQGGLRVFAGPRNDPFFFDLVAFRDAFNFRDPGIDTFAGSNVSAIVIEVTKADLTGDGAGVIGVWSTTSVGGSQLDRFGRPAINTALIPTAMKQAFNQTKPSQDVATFSDEVIASIVGLGRSQADAQMLTGVLLPDILVIDTGKPLAFLNGRGLADDVIDAELQLLTGSPTISDNVDVDDRPTSAQFPYLASPSTATATPPMSLSVTPNSPYVMGQNGIVVQGAGPASAAADAIAMGSGRTVQALWRLSGGLWQYYLPATPGIDGGLGMFSSSVSSVVAVLA